MKKSPKVFIIVLNYNGKEFLRKCLSSIFKIDYSNFEVVLVDNNSSDGSFEEAKNNFSKANFIKNEENVGFAAGVNVGIRFSLERMANYVLILNNDVEVEKDFLSKLVSVAEEDQKIGIASPVVLDAVSKKVWFAGGKINWLRMKTQHGAKVFTEKSYFSEFISGCAMLIGKEVFRKIGLFDEDFFMYWEDADFCARSQKAGFKNVVVANSWVYHYEQSEKNKKNKIYWLVISGLIFFKKNSSGVKKIWVKIYFLVRRIKNLLDVFSGKEEAFIVQKAYKDFKKVTLIK